MIKLNRLQDGQIPHVAGLEEHLEPELHVVAPRRRRRRRAGDGQLLVHVAEAGHHPGHLRRRPEALVHVGRCRGRRRRRRQLAARAEALLLDSGMLRLLLLPPVVAVGRRRDDSVTVEHVTPLLVSTLTDGVASRLTAAALFAALGCLRVCGRRPPPPPAAASFRSSSSLFLRWVCHTFLISLSVRPGIWAAMADHLLATNDKSTMSTKNKKS